MTYEELNEKIAKAVATMTGKKDADYTYLGSIARLFCDGENGKYVVVEPESVIKRSLKTVCSEYDGSKTYPPYSYWRRVIDGYKHQWKIEHGVIKPEADNRDENYWNWWRESFGALAEKFKTKNVQLEAGEKMVSERRRRMIEHLKAGEVLITTPGHRMREKWVSKAFADKNGLTYYNPTHYLEEAKEMGRFGTIEKNI